MTRGPSLQTEPLLNNSPDSIHRAETLEPCPFCGGPAHSTPAVAQANLAALVMCTENDCATVSGPTLFDAIKRWNTRPAATLISELQAETERLGREVECRRHMADKNYTLWDFQRTRAIAAESALSRKQSETVERAAKYLDEIAPYALIHFDSRAGVTSLVDVEDHMTVQVFTKTQLMSAIRSLNKGGEPG